MQLNSEKTHEEESHLIHGEGTKPGTISQNLMPPELHEWWQFARGRPEKGSHKAWLAVSFTTSELPNSWVSAIIKMHNPTVMPHTVCCRCEPYICVHWQLKAAYLSMQKDCGWYSSCNTQLYMHDEHRWELLWLQFDFYSETCINSESNYAWYMIHKISCIVREIHFVSH